MEQAYRWPSFSSTARKTEIDGRILSKINTLFGTPVPPALPNDHENTSKASRAFILCPYLSAMRLGAGVQLVFVLIESAKDRNRRAILRKITTLFGPLGPSCVAKRSREHFTSKQGLHLMPTLERNAPWSRRTFSLCSRRQRESPKAIGDSEGNHHFIWHLGRSCVAKRNGELRSL